MDEVRVRVDQLVLGERRAAARAPFHRAAALVQPIAPVALLQKAPDVLDVRVRERVVVVVPVHPHPEPPGLVGDHLGVLRHALLAALGELGEPVLLDLALRVQAEASLDPDLDPEPLAVEPVLVTLVEAPKGLVALEHVLERPSPAVVRAHRVVGRERPVDEAEALAPAVSLPELVERPLAIPRLEQLELERLVVRHPRQRLEGPVRHVGDPSEGRSARFGAFSTG